MNALKSIVAAAALATVALTGSIAMADDRAVIESFYADLLTDPAATTAEQVRAVVAEEWVSTPQPFGGPGAEGLIRTLGGFGQLVPDLKWTPMEILQDGNRYIVRGMATGTPVGPFFGVEPPTGKSFEIMSIDIHTVENGRITTSYHVEEWATAIQQLTAQ